jgi:hypothetical protein
VVRQLDLGHILWCGRVVRVIQHTGYTELGPDRLKDFWR